MVGIVKYDAGNLYSVLRAFEENGTDVFLSDDPQKLLRADHLVFPGVGRADAAMESLRRKGLLPVLEEFFREGRPLLGICVGCQLLFDFSEEGNIETLGFLPGRVKRFPEGTLKVPQMGWNTLELRKKESPLFRGISSFPAFYFAHSYYAVPEDERDVGATAEHGLRFPALVIRGALAGIQCHPEKSGKAGLRFLKNFASFSSYES